MSTAPLLATQALSDPTSQRTPIDELLARQHELTPVERFAQAHEADLVPAGARWWQDRIPATAPGPGQQYAFDVDLDACTGCKACVTACHSLNGLEGDEAWRSVGTLHGVGADGPLLQTVTTACHHCVDPACLDGCPVDAYDKDPVTGIVAHLDDQCIGCSYCTLTCPYEVPTFNRSLGIVRKCDLCSGRLAAGEAPACVQGCPNGAITVQLVDVEEVVAAARAPVGATGSTPRLVPNAPASSLTAPTTRYRSRRPELTGGDAALVAGDHRSVRPGHGHTPLVVMLVLTQLAVGVGLVGQALRWGAADGEGAASDGVLAVLALAAAVVALGASVLHLGRPLLAWRAVAGIRHSWLSREIVAFGAFATAAAADAVAAVAHAPDGVLAATGAAVVVTGVAGVACSGILYAVTGRAWWRLPTTGTRFAATTLGCGGLVVAAVVAATAPAGAATPATAAVALALVAVATGLVVQVAVLIVGARRDPELAMTRALLGGPLLSAARWRGLLAAGGGLALPIAALAALVDQGAGTVPAVLAGAGAVLLLAAELVERRLFFVASVPPRMPGLAT